MLPTLSESCDAPLLAPPTPAPAVRSWREFFAARKAQSFLSSFAASVLVHSLILILFSLTYFAASHVSKQLDVVIVPHAAEEAPLETIDIPRAELPDDFGAPLETAPEDDASFELPNIPAPLVAPPQAPPAQLARADGDVQPRLLITEVNKPKLSGGGFEGRTAESKAALLGKHGGNQQSEDAVALGLAWLAAHQRANGSWNFDHRSHVCDGLCENPGTAGTTTGATAMALLPFLGAGHTHQRGPHAETIKQGLYYLQGRIRRTPHGGDFMEGTMYAQGLTAVALCEAYALSGDEELRPFAQQAIDYICYAQHEAGGWRYFPGQPGDTTVFGWQFMALKSASLAKLEVPSPTIEQAERYLDSVQSGSGAYYGYLKTGQDPTPTAVGLLSRMYLGWPRDKAELRAGEDYLAKLGPSADDMYFNYYATQVLHHRQSRHWEKWNTKLRDHLIQTQATTGHQRGSWFFADKHSLAGGRLGSTALCVMILEVYYRHMPLYGDRTVKEGF